MANCNEVTQIDINVIVDTVGSGGIETLDMGLGSCSGVAFFLFILPEG